MRYAATGLSMPPDKRRSAFIEPQIKKSYLRFWLLREFMNYSIDVCCAGPEELEASRIPDSYLWRTVSLFWDPKGKESQAYYFAQIDADQIPHILLVHDDFYTPEEEAHVFPQILQIIA